MIRNVFSVLLLCLLSNQAFSQSIYSTNFGTSGTSYPAGWSSSNSTLIKVDATSVSSGYPGPPPASGSNNIQFYQSATGFFNTLVTITVNPSISTVGKSNIRVGFGNRKTGAFDRVVAFDYSIDNGASWSNLSADLTADFGSNTTWAHDFIDLPSDADNVSNLRFRFQYTTDVNGSQASANFRIDDFAVGINNSLPIELSAFAAKIVNQQSHLNWSTQTERDNDYFSIERGDNITRFEEIGQVKGAGDSNEPQHYTFTDKTPLPGKNYYRLRQVDFDGTFSYSPMVSVNFGDEGGITLSPVPIRDQLRVQLEKANQEDGTWQIIDMNGRILRSGVFPAESTEYQINASDLPEGSYVFRLVAGRAVWVRRF